MKSIIFTAENVRTTQDGRKTQTRRVVKFGKPQPEHGVIVENNNGVLEIKSGNTIYKAKSDKQVGDILYVKETWGTYTKDWCDSDRFLYRADYPNDAKGYWHEPEQINWCDFPKWRSPMFMPQEAARLFLRVTGVRAEKLHDIVKHDIDVGDIRSEGIIEPCIKCETLPGNFNGSCRKIMGKNECGMINAYAERWDSINKKSGHGWNTNPWVWVYTFERAEEEKE